MNPSMKRALFLLIFIRLFCPAGAQTESEIIKQAGELVGNKKYETAFNVLNQFDPSNGRPDIVLMKQDILLNFFVTSIMHQVFALKDLEKNETVEDYRGKAGSYSLHSFDSEEILDSLIRIRPDYCTLYKGLARYYYEVLNHYGQKWLKSEKDLLQLIRDNDKKVTDLGCADYMTYYHLGYIDLMRKEYPAAINSLQKTVAMNAHFADAFYNLAYACMASGDGSNAENYARRALALYADRTSKGDAARMLGQILSDKKEDKNAIAAYEQSDRIDPGIYYTLRPLLYLYVKTSDPKTKDLTRRFFELDPAKPTIYNDLVEIYSSNNRDADLIAFYTEQLDIVKKDPKVLGNLHFYLAREYAGTDNAKAREHYAKARELFLQVYPKDHEVFRLIDNELKQ
jgi:tetratricopeptide (TPR) repeat protein